MHTNTKHYVSANVLKPERTGSKERIAIMPILLRLHAMISHITRITQHTYHVTTVKQTMPERGRGVGNLLVPLLLVGSFSHAGVVSSEPGLLTSYAPL